MRAPTVEAWPADAVSTAPAAEGSKQEEEEVEMCCVDVEASPRQLIPTTVEAINQAFPLLERDKAYYKEARVNSMGVTHSLR